MNFLKKSFNTVTNALEINKLKDKLYDLEKEKKDIELEKFNNNFKVSQKEIMLVEMNKLFNASNDNLNALESVAFNKTDFTCDYSEFVQKNSSEPEIFLFKKLYDNLKKNNELINDVINYYNNVKSNDYYDAKIEVIEKNISDIRKKLNAVRVKQFGKKENHNSGNSSVDSEIPELEN